MGHHCPRTTDNKKRAPRRDAPDWLKCLLIPGRTIDDQQIDISIVLEITFNAIVAECEPGYFFDQGPNGFVCKIYHTILRRLAPNARIVDSIQAALTQLVLDYCCINRFLYSSYLHMSIAPVGGWSCNAHSNCHLSSHQTAYTQLVPQSDSFHRIC